MPQFDIDVTPLVCPQTHKPLSLKDGFLIADNQQQGYPIADGIPNCTYPPQLGSDNEWSLKLYNKIAPFYAWSERVLGKLITGINLVEARKEFSSLIPANPGETVLDVSPGPGVDQPCLAQKLGANGRIWAIDLSRGMLNQCRKNCINQVPRPQLIQGNGSHLPFVDNFFDGLFHFGGINLFDEPERALAEFARVVKPNGWIVFGDEQFSQAWRSRTGLRIKILQRMNPGFLRNPPEIPPSMKCQSKHVVLGGLGYLWVCRKVG